MVRKASKSSKSIASQRKLVAGDEAVDVAETPDLADGAGDGDAGKADGDAPALGKRDLIDRVVEASGIKKKAAKPVVEAMLKELGDALSRGETLNLQPFGKANVKRTKELEHAEIIEVRLRRSKLAIKAAEAAEQMDATVIPLDPLAEAAE